MPGCERATVRRGGGERSNHRVIASSRTRITPGTTASGRMQRSTHSLRNCSISSPHSAPTMSRGALELTTSSHLSWRA